VKDSKFKLEAILPSFDWNGRPCDGLTISNKSGAAGNSERLMFMCRGQAFLDKAAVARIHHLLGMWLMAQEDDG